MRDLVKAAVLTVLALSTAQARVFFVGSNPYLSMFAFPQDVSRLDGNFIFY